MIRKRVVFGLASLVNIICWQESAGQEVHRFILFAGVGNSNTSNSFSVRSIEPSIWLKNVNAVLGLRLESFDKPLVEKCNSFTLNYQYCLTKRHSPFLANKLLIFMGLGLGTYVAKDENLVLSNAIVGGAKGQLYTFIDNVNNGRIGFYPRATFVYNHIGFIVDYNFIYREHLENNYYFFTPTTSQTWRTSSYRSGNYLAFKICYFFHRKK